MVRRKFSASPILLTKNLFSLKNFISFYFLIFLLILFCSTLHKYYFFISLICYGIILTFYFALSSVLFLENK